MPDSMSSPWIADRWSDTTRDRLAWLYAEADRPARRARALREALTAAAVRQAGKPVLLCVPCGSFDEVLAVADLDRRVAAAGACIVVLLLPDADAVEMAMTRAARENLSRWLYFCDAANFDRDALVRRVGSQASVEVLSTTLDLPTSREAGQPTGVAAGGGMLATLADLGEPIGTIRPWLDAALGAPRPEPLFADRIDPPARAWLDAGHLGLVGRAPGSGFEPARILEPSRITCYENRVGPGNDVVHGFALGHGCRLDVAEDLGPRGTPGTPFVWGVLRGSDRVVESAVAQGHHFLYCDHAYFGRGHLRNYRIVLDGHATTGLRRCSDERTAGLGVALRPWRVGGRHVLVCPPTQYFMDAHGCPNWLQDTLDALARHTDRPLVVRDKPKAGEAARPLEEDLADCHALVTHSSNVAVEAAVAGVPVFVDPHCAAIAVGASDLSTIETPVTPERSLWLANLAWTQFSFEEILRGEALDRLCEYWSAEAER